MSMMRATTCVIQWSESPLNIIHKATGVSFLIWEFATWFSESERSGCSPSSI